MLKAQGSLYTFNLLISFVVEFSNYFDLHIKNVSKCQRIRKRGRSWKKSDSAGQYLNLL